MDQNIKFNSLVYLYKEQKHVKISLYRAVERKAPSIDIENLTKKLEVLDWLIGVAIKEDENA